MPSNQALRVLIVEDESLLAMTVEDALIRVGWSVPAAAASVPEALSAVERGGFDIALLDINLGGQKVFPVADALLARGVPLVFASAYGGEGLREDLRHLPIIAKPFSHSELVTTLREAMERGALPSPEDAEVS
ncbi:response regulator [Luteimonas deserti]|uniref:Response regulator n=1 Tax=Luteimonas deserti TaxID=2752306 RepID=A0A7Z0QT02_9GAMM|nr:response regulator [Luteimonas deserti]NYZ63180.1 response regulator [Luteimonas deserti]